MRIKSYFSRTVEEAIAAARQELGADAMLIHSRRSPAESRHLGAYEVVFGIDSPAPAVAAPPAVNDRLAADVDKLKKAIDLMRLEISRGAVPAASPAADTGSSEAYNTLVRAEVDPDLASEIAQAAAHHDLVMEIESRFEVDPSLGRGDQRPRIAALVGPPGAGKTSTLVKLAVHYGLAARRPAVLLSTDTYRIGAADQLRSFAAILGVGFQVADTITALAQAIEEHSSKDLILIDTPGYSAHDIENAAPLARFLSTRGDIDTHLVLSASMKPADLRRTVTSFEIFRPNKLLFTRFDETGSLGPVFSEAARTQKPLSFFTSGQSIPEDLEPASKRRLIDLLLAGESPAVQSAAA